MKLNNNYLICLTIDDSKFDERIFYYFLTKEDINELIRKKSTKQRKHYLYSRVLIRFYGSQILGIDPKYLIIKKEIHGKPYFPLYPQLHFNISHSNNMIAIAFSNQPIGIDVELIKKYNSDIAEKCFSDKEIEYIYNNMFDEKKFIEIWTKKEAYIKYLGEKLTIIKKFCVFDIEIKKNIYSFEKNNYYLSFCSRNEYKLFDFYDLMEENLIDVIYNKKIFMKEPKK